MDTEYSQKKLNKKGFLFLVFLIGFSVLVLKITKTDDIRLFKGSSKSTVCANQVIERGYDNTPVFLDMSSNGTITDVTPKASKSVLGVSCGGFKNQYTADSACTIPGSSKDDVSINGNEWVSGDSEIKLTEVTVPVRLLSGIYSVENSNRELTYRNPVYKPAGEQFNNKQILIKSTPGEGNAEMKKNIIDNAVKKEAYSTKYVLSAGAKESDGDVLVNQYASNDCGSKCNNDANSNPDKSNKAGEYFKNINYRYPGQKDTGKSSNSITIDGICNNTSPAEIDTDTKVGCLSVWHAIIGAIGSIFPSSDWTNCSAGKEGCVNSEEIVVKMSPMFEGTNGFTTTRNKVAMDPGSSNSYKSVYVMTPCDILVGNKTAHVKCAWDMSYIFDERKVAEFDDVGKSETPTEVEYIKFLQGESLVRKDPLYSM